MADERYIRQIKARLLEGVDDDLDAILKHYARAYRQSDVIRLALYRLLDVALPDDLLGLAAEFEAAPMVDDRLLELVERGVVALDRLASAGNFPVDRGSRAPPTSPTISDSGGIDMSGPAPRARTVAPPDTLPEDDFDPVDAARKLVESVKGFSGNATTQ